MPPNPTSAVTPGPITGTGRASSLRADRPASRCTVVACHLCCFLPGAVGVRPSGGPLQTGWPTWVLGACWATRAGDFPADPNIQSLEHLFRWVVKQLDRDVLKALPGLVGASTSSEAPSSTPTRPLWKQGFETEECGTLRAKPAGEAQRLCAAFVTSSPPSGSAR